MHAYGFLLDLEQLMTTITILYSRTKPVTVRSAGRRCDDQESNPHHLIKFRYFYYCKSDERQDDELQDDACGNGPDILYLRFEVGKVDGC